MEKSAKRRNWIKDPLVVGLVSGVISPLIVGIII